MTPPSPASRSDMLLARAPTRSAPAIAPRASRDGRSAFRRSKAAPRLAAAACCIIAADLAAGAASAQVLEIGGGGEVTVYDRPSVFNDRGATPIIPAPRETRRSPAAASASAGASQDLTDAARAAQLSPALVEAVAWTESRSRPRLVSPAGAIGEMQLMPATARSLGVDPLVSRQNYRGGAAYLSALMRRYDGDLIRALAAYNAGPGAVDRWGGAPPFRETRAYVSAIMDRLTQRALASVEATGVR